MTPASLVRRCAIQTGMIDSRITTTATTLTTGSWFGRDRLRRIQIGRVVGSDRERRHDDLVEAEREREQGAREHRRAERREGHVTERLPAVRTQFHRRLLERLGRASQARHHVVVDHDDAEGRVPDDDREQPEADAEGLEHGAEGGVQRDARDDAGKGDRQDHEERDRVAAEERIARDRERGERAEHERDRRRAEAGLDRRQQRVAGALVVDRSAPPVERQAVEGPALRARGVEGVEADHDQRQVDEGQRQAGREAQQRAG